MFKPKITPFNYISQNYFVWNSKAMVINHHLIWKQDMAPQADPEGQRFESHRVNHHTTQNILLYRNMEGWNVLEGMLRRARLKRSKLIKYVMCLKILRCNQHFCQVEWKWITGKIIQKKANSNSRELSTLRQSKIYF